MSGEEFDADYFLRGKQTGKSLYENYQWMPELTIPMVQAIITHCGIQQDETVLDFGCARGYVVKAFRQLGFYAYGYDISKWALENADPEVYHNLTCKPEIAFTVQYDWVIAKDVLEHIEELDETIDKLMNAAMKGMFVVVPLSHDGKRYDVAEYEQDITHIHRRPLQWWVGHFHRMGWEITGQYRVVGVKDNWAYAPESNGFITCRRIGGLRTNA